LKRLSARSKFSSSWIMTSDKFYFPPSWRFVAGYWTELKGTAFQEMVKFVSPDQT
jgi:hypothetical protein